MTKAQIKAITAESARLVATKNFGVAPLSGRYATRLAEIKKKVSSQQSGSNERSSSYHIAASSSRD